MAVISYLAWQHYCLFLAIVLPAEQHWQDWLDDATTSWVQLILLLTEHGNTGTINRLCGADCDDFMADGSGVASMSLIFVVVLPQVLIIFVDLSPSQLLFRLDPTINLFMQKGSMDEIGYAATPLVSIFCWKQHGNIARSLDCYHLSPLFAWHGNTTDLKSFCWTHWIGFFHPLLWTNHQSLRFTVSFLETTTKPANGKKTRKIHHSREVVKWQTFIQCWKLAFLICKRWYIKQMQPMPYWWCTMYHQIFKMRELQWLAKTNNWIIDWNQKFLKQGSNTHAAAWHIMKKLHTSEFNSKYGVMVTIDSEYGNDKVPKVCTRKMLYNYTGETIPGRSDAGKLFNECSAYGNWSGKNSVEIPETWVSYSIAESSFHE